MKSNKYGEVTQKCMVKREAHLACPPLEGAGAKRRGRIWWMVDGETRSAFLPVKDTKGNI